ncbi:MAG: hypothetical protein O3A21_08000 [Proteobacteria bacterium]|nr:hypothetical protein [Pseudomonadota bacterium]
MIASDAGERPMPQYGGRRATRYRSGAPVLLVPVDGKAFPVGFTHDDLDHIEARFDAATPESCWCGYGTWQGAHPSRVVLFRAGKKSLRLTLTRLSDGTYDLLTEAGLPIARNVSLDEAIDQVIS